MKTIKINDKVVSLSELSLSEEGQRRYRAIAHVKGIGTVYVTTYAGRPKREPPATPPHHAAAQAAPALVQVLAVLNGLSKRLSALEQVFQQPVNEMIPAFSPPH